jgi:maleylacetate reductase
VALTTAWAVFTPGIRSNPNMATPPADFTYEALPYRVIFGAGSVVKLHEEAGKLGIKRAMVLTTPEQRSTGEMARDWLGELHGGIFSEARMHTPVDVTTRALARVNADNVDGLVAIGGGSTIGLSKAISLRTGLPQIAVPTTYAGSEMTPIIGETSAGIKTTKVMRQIVPNVVIYGVDLTLDLPPLASAASGMNAMAHAVEALYAPDANPIASMMADASIAALARALPRISTTPRDQSARSEALYGAWLGGACLGAVRMSLHHKLCHVLGGMFDLPHAQTHAIILAHVAEYNAKAAADAMARVSRALGARSAPAGLYDLAQSIGLPQSLAQLGMPEDGIERAADEAMRNPYANPQPLDRDRIRDLIARAFRGEHPEEIGSGLRKGR